MICRAADGAWSLHDSRKAAGEPGFPGYHVAGRSAPAHGSPALSLQDAVRWTFIAHLCELFHLRRARIELPNAGAAGIGDRRYGCYCKVSFPDDEIQTDWRCRSPFFCAGRTRDGPAWNRQHRRLRPEHLLCDQRSGKSPQQVLRLHGMECLAATWRLGQHARQCLLA